MTSYMLTALDERVISVVPFGPNLIEAKAEPKPENRVERVWRVKLVKALPTVVLSGDYQLRFSTVTVRCDLKMMTAT